MWGKVLSFFSSTPKAIDTALDVARDISSGLDVLVLTDEERIQYQARAVDQWMEIQKAIAGENGERGVTRRILAKNLVSALLILIFWAAAVYQVSENYAAFLLSLARLLMPWVGGIVAFYFVYYGVQSVAQKKG